MRAPSSILFQIPVGANGDMADLGSDFVDNMVNQCFAIQKYEPFVFSPHAACLTARQYQCKSFYRGRPFGKIEGFHDYSLLFPIFLE